MVSILLKLIEDSAKEKSHSTSLVVHWLEAKKKNVSTDKSMVVWLYGLVFALVLKFLLAL